jgi:hypothetical protein
MHGNKKAGKKANNTARHPRTSNDPARYGKPIPKMKDYTGKSGTGSLPSSAVRGLKT